MEIVSATPGPRRAIGRDGWASRWADCDRRGRLRPADPRRERGVGRGHRPSGAASD